MCVVGVRTSDRRDESKRAIEAWEEDEHPGEGTACGTVARLVSLRSEDDMSVGF